MARRLFYSPTYLYLLIYIFYNKQRNSGSDVVEDVKFLSMYICHFDKQRENRNVG